MGTVVPGMDAGAIVTPEAVRLEFETAGLASRALARILDVAAALFLLQAVLTAISFTLVALSDVALIVAGSIVVFLAIFGYPAAAETWFQGRTVGKALLGLRVVTVEGGPVGFRQAAIRSMFQVVDFVFVPGGAIAVVSALCTRRSQRVGDLVAGTFVVRERQGVTDPGAVPFPPPWGYEAYVASLDPSVLGPDGHRRIRSYLLRTPSLTPEARGRLSLAFAEPVAARMGHRPPPNVSPELFLYCVAAAHQWRSGGTVRMAGPQPPPPAAAPPPSFPAASPPAPPSPPSPAPPYRF
jgi:uncharacterized RDD family membrane protein YckC